MKRQFIRFVSATTAVGLSAAFLCTSAAFASNDENAERVIRVGWYESGDGTSTEEATGAHGYDREYLQALAQYTGWTYEYVSCTWEACLEKLEDGEIDLLGFAAKTPERELIYGYPNLPMAVTNAWLVTDCESDLPAADPTVINGMNVGIVRGNSYNAVFAEYCEKNDCTVNYVTYDSLSDISPALASGEIDTAVVSDEDVTCTESKYMELASSSRYYVTDIDNSELLAELNEAMLLVHTYYPNINSNLYQEYFNENSGIPLFTAAELEFIAQNPTIAVTVDSDWPPVEYFDEVSGTYKGMIPDMFALLEEKTGIDFVIYGATSGEQLDQMEDGNALNVLTSISWDYDWAEQHNVYITQPFLSSQIVKLGRNLDVENPTVAINESAYFTFALRNVLAGVNTIHFSKASQRLEAIRTGEADYTYVTEDQANYYCAQPKYADFEIEKMIGYEQKVCICIPDNSDPALVSIISKAVASVTHDEQTAILRNNTTEIYEWTASDFLYAYRIPVVIIAFLVVIIIVFLLVFLTLNHSRRKRDLKRSAQMERYIGYLCDMYYKVLEVDLDLHSRKQYMKKDGKVEIQERNDFTAFAIESIHPDDVAASLAVFAPEAMHSLAVSGKDECYVESRMQTPDGQYRWYSFLLKMIPKDEEHPCSAMLLIKDIETQRKEREHNNELLVNALDAATAASRSKSAFLSSMSHEIRTPLNAVIGYMTVANNFIDNHDKVLHCIDNAGVAARHLLSIINDVLDISAMESGKIKLAREQFDIKEQISGITTVFYQQCKQKGVKFEIFVENLTEEWVVGDPMRVNQILMNLMSNAVKFTNIGGSIHLLVTQLSLESDKVYLRFTVKDTGIGMSQEYLSRLFTPFEQESAQTAQKYGGTGLGMSISFNLVKLMGGKIDVQSAQQVGTTFTVTLPFGRAESKQIPTLPKDFSRVHVLVVDDLENECDYVHALLTRCGVSAKSASSGAEAIRMVTACKDTPERFDLCIIDWNMPGLNGVETTKLIHQECDPDIPIIIATAYDISEFEGEAIAAGAAKIVSKPLFQSTLFDLLVSTYGKYDATPAEADGIPDMSGMHVLLAEDNEMNIEVAVDLLELAGITVEVARNGQEAVAMFCNNGECYDAILMDVQMPVMDGYAATRAIRESTHPHAKTIPIIAMTANAFAEDVTASLAAGMNGHLAKPVDADKLYQTLQQLRLS